MLHQQTPKTDLEMTAKQKPDKYSILLAKNEPLSKTLRGPLYDPQQNTNHQRLPAT